MKPIKKSSVVCERRIRFDMSHENSYGSWGRSHKKILHPYSYVIWFIACFLRRQQGRYEDNAIVKWIWIKCDGAGKNVERRRRTCKRKYVLFLVPGADAPVLWPPSLFSSVQPLRALAVHLTSPAPITLLLSVLVCCHRVHAQDTLCLSFEEQTEISPYRNKSRESRKQ